MDIITSVSYIAYLTILHLFTEKDYIYFFIICNCLYQGLNNSGIAAVNVRQATDA